MERSLEKGRKDNSWEMLDSVLKYTTTGMPYLPKYLKVRCNVIARLRIRCVWLQGNNQVDQKRFLVRVNVLVHATSSNYAKYVLKTDLASLRLVYFCKGN